MIRNPKELPATMYSDCPANESVDGTLTAMPLEGLRDARQMTQVQMAQLLKISQGAVSKVERRSDMFVSTLRNYVRAIGGDLQIRAVFPDGEVLIDQFGDLERSESGRPPRSAAKRDDPRHKAEPAISSGQ